jgi:hypothetical protein
MTFFFEPRCCYLILILLASTSACKSLVKKPASGLQSDQQSEVRLPTMAGPKFILVTKEEAEFIREISETGNMYHNPKFWNFYRTHPQLTNELLEKKWFSQIPTERQKILEIAATLGAHSGLLLDPGIYTRAQEFSAFALKALSKNPNISSLELRDAFAATLAKAVVWRGVLLTEEEAKVVKNMGIMASGFYSEKEYRNDFLASEYLGKNGYSNPAENAYVDLNRRLGGQTRTSVFGSYSNWIEVTYAGAWAPAVQGGGPLRSAPGMSFYLFKVEVSELDIIRPVGSLAPLIQGKKSQIYKTQGVDGQPWQKSFGDPEFEMFIQFVKPSSILEIIKYPNMPPRWN